MKNFISVKLQSGKGIMISTNYIFGIESTSEHTCRIGMNTNDKTFQLINVDMSIEEVKSLINQAL